MRRRLVRERKELMSRRLRDVKGSREKNKRAHEQKAQGRQRGELMRGRKRVHVEKAERRRRLRDGECL